MSHPLHHSTEQPRTIDIKKQHQSAVIYLKERSIKLTNPEYPKLALSQVLQGDHQD